MNRREFSVTAAGLTAFSLMSGGFRLAAARAGERTTPFFVKGLAMVSFGDTNLQIALPKAPHHAATLGVVPSGGGDAISTPLHGNGRLIASASGGQKPEVRVPSLVDVRELYPHAVARIENSPTIITIPWSRIASVTAETLSEERWTFVEKATGNEVVTFRPRKLAESLRFDLLSAGTFEINDTTLDLGDVDQISTDFVPTTNDTGGYTDHFHYYMPYLELEAGAPELEPRELTRRARNRPVPSGVGNAFAAARVWPWNVCFPFRVQ